MMKLVDNLLNRITMYRLTLYCLLFLLAAAAVLGYFKILPYGPIAIAGSAALLVAVSLAANEIFARVFRVPANIESAYITALILALIITPYETPHYAILIWAAVWAMASKYMFAIGKKHLFNPAAFAVAFTAITINQSASWWIGTLAMLPFALIAGFLVVRKIQRFDLALSFLLVALLTIAVTGAARGTNPLTLAEKAITGAPLIFFASIMLTEPLTTPPTKILRIFYGMLVGFLFSPYVHLGSVYSTPELALLLGNIFSYAVSPKRKYVLKLKEKNKIAPDVYDFLFRPDKRVAFRPGQYLEWTLGRKSADSRGNRRYFTIASSPAEEDVRLGVKFYEKPSSFKKNLLEMKEGDEVVAGQLAGDFTLPRDKKRKLVFFAGGIGITPFRSMLKQMVQNLEIRPVVVFYLNKTADEIVYADVLNEARERLGIKTVYALTDEKNIPPGWGWYKGRISAETIAKEVPDYRERIFYLSGPRSMVTAFEEVLKSMRLKRWQIKTDFFPGFA